VSRGLTTVTAGVAAGTEDDNGSAVHIAVHYLMQRPHHLLYMGLTATCDPTTQPASILLPLPSWRYPNVMHTLHIGPRATAPFSFANPKFAAASNVDVASDVDLSSLGEVLGVDV